MNTSTNTDAVRPVERPLVNINTDFRNAPEDDGVTRTSADMDTETPGDKYSHITTGAGGKYDDSLDLDWNEVEAAAEHAPLPAGAYIVHVIEGRRFNASKKGTPGYKLTFRVVEGEYADRLLYCDYWLTRAALPMTKRDLAPLGITTAGQLDQPIPPGIRCRCKVVIRANNDGEEYNQVRKIEVIGIDQNPTIDPDFPPGPEELTAFDDPTGESSTATTTTQPTAAENGSAL